MRLRNILFCIMLALNFSVQACTTCGCAAYNSFMGISGYSFNHFIGLTYNYFVFAENDETFGLRNSQYQKAEFRGAYAVNEKLQILGGIPLVMNKYSSAELNYAATDIGDVNISANYLLYNNTKNIMRNATHWLVVNGGVELPTGSFNTNFRAEKFPPALSAGSESTDVLAGLQYTVATKHWNFRTAFQFKLNTKNNAGYNFGEQYSAEIFAARKCMLKKVQLVPYVGSGWEHLTTDTYYTLEMDGTGADNFALHAGTELNFQKFNIGANAGFPISSSIGDVQLQNALKLQAYASYSF